MTRVPTTAASHWRPSDAAPRTTALSYGRAREADVAYIRSTPPLLGMDRPPEDHNVHPGDRGLSDTPRSSYLERHSDEPWQQLKTVSPTEWADAVAFNAAVRHGPTRANTNGHRLRGTSWPPPLRRPLDQVRPRPANHGGTAAQGCGPWTCPATTAAGDTPGEVA